MALIQLLQLADSALPIGSTAHSFGLESLVAEGLLNVANLEDFLQDYLDEMGRLEGAFCRLAHRMACSPDQAEHHRDWRGLNRQASALKPARESRQASATLGRRFLQLAITLTTDPYLQQALTEARTNEVDIHYGPAFGLVSGRLQIAENASVAAYLHQSLLGLVSACQRLMPLGQSQASSIIWRLKPRLHLVAQASATPDLALVDCEIFTPLIDLASMRHPTLTTRLFIS